ncbi:MAG: penicillin-binding protein, partial [Candidatus Gracilibacteria bacterium]|nr:penicillin-binding protein [Candidatus Gracilibacteria bacterium]
MINAIVAGEDKSFFENSGIDYFGIFRAVYNRIRGRTQEIQGTSTISQQLIKNTLLTNERSYERKIKEAFLSFRMNQKYSKEKILELYLNKIGFGSNSYGIQQASLTFFNKKISDVNIIESSILASLPKGPTYYSPYNYPDRLLGYIYTYNSSTPQNITKIYSKEHIKEHNNSYNLIVNELKKLTGKKVGENGIEICGLDKNKLKNNFKINSNNCYTTTPSEILSILNSIQIKDGNNIIEYQTGRKDYILQRMLDDGHINFDEYKEALLLGIGFEFNKYIERIKYPHFVMYIIEYLSEKYGEELIQGGGLRIHTTLDSKLQDKAEEILKKQVSQNYSKFNANNGALISIDNKTGDILAYIGGADYFNDTIDGQVNMLSAKRQPGSTFKSFIYALAIDNNKIGDKTPIYDLPTIFPGNYEPKNFDGKFNGRMSLAQALNYSRNIPAIKSYFLAGEQKNIISKLKEFGISSLNESFYYGAPLALGTGEISPLELVGAYSVFANMGNKVEINPILKVLDTRGLVVEEKKQSSGKKVLDEATSYIINSILSSNDRPTQFWNTALSLTGRKAAVKTGTSNIV